MNVFINKNSESVSISILTIEALANETGPGEKDPGTIITSGDNCRNAGGYWNMALTCARRRN